MINDIISLTKQFISIPSVTSNIPALEEIFALVTHELEGFPFIPFTKNNYPSLLYTNSNLDTKQFKIILNAHLDVVQGENEQYTPIIRENKLYGRGAYDMKAAAATMIILFKELSKKIDYPLALQLVSDEENTSEYGTQYHIKQGIRASFVITGEGTNLNIVNKSKGLLEIQLKTDGKHAHSGYPWLGENAITKMHTALDAIIKAYPAPTTESYETIVHVTNISTKNSANNKIPADCTAHIDIRFIMEDKDMILKKIQSLLPSYISMEILCEYPPNDTNADNTYLKLLRKSGEIVLKNSIPLTVAYAASDMAFFKKAGCEGVEFGPLGNGHHSDSEWVDIQSIEDYYHILKNFLLSAKNL